MLIFSYVISILINVILSLIWAIPLQALSELYVNEPCQVSQLYVIAFINSLFYCQNSKYAMPTMDKWETLKCLKESNKTWFYTNVFKSYQAGLLKIFICKDFYIQFLLITKNLSWQKGTLGVRGQQDGLFAFYSFSESDLFVTLADHNRSCEFNWIASWLIPAW